MAEVIHGIACGPDGCKPITMSREEFDALIHDAEQAKAGRAEDMPTTEDALRVLHDAFTRLKELGWRDAIYAPRDGTTFEAIEAGSTGVHPCHVTMLKGEHPSYWVDDEWPSRPILFRPLPRGSNA